MTEYFDVTLGVGQGDPGSTFLFDVYIDDLLEELHSRPEDTKIPLGDDADTHAAGPDLCGRRQCILVVT